MRVPTAEGFYPHGKEQVEEFIKKAFSEINVKKRRINGGIVPHAGYIYSGKTASHVYKSLSGDYEGVVLIGPNHTGMGENMAISKEDWETSLGTIKNNKNLTKELLDSSKLIRVDELSHMYEHSVEVQLPFLQYVLKDFTFVPLSVSSSKNIDIYKEAGNAIKKVIKNRKVLVIASSDFTHFGTMYSFSPVNKNEADWVKNTDRKIIDAILEFDVERFVELASSSTVCGYGAIATLLYAMKGTKASLLNYSTSYDVSKNKDAIVGYAGIVFE
jgi:AmmeMemoRadiSam system protein B